MPQWEPALRIPYILAPFVIVAAATTAAARVPDTPAIPTAEDAPIALMVDGYTGQILYAREADRRFMPASITKVMSTFLAFEWMDEGRLLPQQWFQVPPEVFEEWHGVGSTMFLPLNARVTVDDLLHGVTTVSANDGAAALAVGAAGSLEKWAEAMNAKARAIGMANSHFSTPNGWMDEGRTFVTARDLATLGSAMIRLHPQKYRHFVGQHGFSYNGITQANHDPISGKVEGADGIKTGFTNQAGFGFLGSAERDGRRLVMVVAGSPRGNQRNNAARGFIEWGFAAFDARPLYRAGSRVGTVAVQDGGVSDVEVRTDRPILVHVPHGSDPQVKLTLRYEGPVQAPIEAGERVAELLVSAEGMPPFRVPLVASEDVAKAGPLRRLANGLTAWLP